MICIHAVTCGSKQHTLSRGATLDYVIFSSPQLRLAMGSRVLTPVQFARVHLETYPAGVDVVALTK